MKITPVRSFQLKLVFSLLTILSKVSTVDAIAVRPGVDPVMNQRLFNQGIDAVLANLIEKGGDSVLTFKNGRRLTLTEIRKRVPSIDFVFHQGMLTADGEIHCKDQMHSYWVTVAERPKAGRPAIFQGRFMDVSDFRAEDWLLFLHETLGALGYVDDEYQISGPLLALARATPQGQSMQALAEHYPELRRIETRTRTPRYRLDKAETCWRYPEEGGRGVRVASNTTGIGGGGNGVGLLMKADLLAGADAWAAKANIPKQQLAAFRARLVEIGLEPSPIQGANVPVEIEFKKSKRTGKPSAFLRLENLYRLKLEQPSLKVLLDYKGPPEAPMRSALQGEWCGALILIYEHVARSLHR
jgi:hypothetical protein